MFRKGGSTEEGVMYNVKPRTNFQEGMTKKMIEDRAKLYRQYAGDPIANLLIQGGLGLISGEGAGKGTLGSIATAFQKPVAQALAQEQQIGLKAASDVFSREEAERIAKIKAGSTMSTIARRAKEAILSGANNPSTGKPFKNYQEAYTYYSMSATDISRASPAERLDEEEKKLIAGGGSTKYAPAQAKYNVQIRDKIPPIKRGGLFKSKKGQPKKPITGNYYYDLDSEQLYLFDGKTYKVVTDIESIK